MRARGAETASLCRLVTVAIEHCINGNPVTGRFPERVETDIFGMGCFCA